MRELVKVKRMKQFSIPKSMRSPILPRIALLCFLLVLLLIGAVPSYWTGNWSWVKPPPVANLKQLKELRQTGLDLPGWKTLEQKTATLGGHKWSVQAIQRDSPKPVRLMLFPQSDHKSQPQVEWVDVNEFERWKTDSYKKMQFVVEASQLENSTGASKLIVRPAAEVEASFFRAWNRQQTMAVLQWYAWHGGGSPAPSRWFWADRLAQLQRNRVPWVAVCLQIPIEPLGDIEASRQTAESLAKMVQSALMLGPLAQVSS